MSENQNRTARDFSKYDSMDTPELEAIVRLDCEALEGQTSDTELILYVAGVLAKRKKYSTGKTALEAWESFEKNYLPTEEAEEACTQPKPAKKVRPGVRRFAAVAAVVVLLVGLAVTACAIRWAEVWNAVAQWAKETFSFVQSDADLTEPDQRMAQQYSSLQEALDATGLNVDFLPTWIPDGYELKDITVDENPMQNIYIAYYINNEKTLKITVRSHLMIVPEKVEINANIIEIYEMSGIQCYIFANNQQLRAAWVKDSYECNISGELTVDEIKTMIDSIGKG